MAVGTCKPRRAAALVALGLVFASSLEDNSRCFVASHRCQRPRLPPLQAAPDGAPGDIWTVLGVSADCTRDELKSAFKKRVLKVHPDAGGSPSEFFQLQLAYKTALGQVPRDGSRGVKSSGEPASTWSINDFFRWRREQAQEEHARWVKDAEKTRSQWPGFDRRQREEEELEEEAEERRAAEEAELRRALHSQPNYPGLSGRTKFRSDEGPRNTNMHNSDWATFLNRRRERQTAAAQSVPEVAKEDRGSTVVSHRVLHTEYGSIRVPVYQAASGERYYRSPRTSQKVMLPN